jgi:hypothetical protein
MIWAPTNQCVPFVWSPLPMAGKQFCDQHRGRYNQVNFSLNLIDLLNCFHGEPVQHPWEAFHLSEGVDPSNHIAGGANISIMVVMFVVGSCGLWKEFSAPAETKKRLAVVGGLKINFQVG